MAIEITGAGIDVGLVARDSKRLLDFYQGFLGLVLARVMDLKESMGLELFFLSVGASHLKIVAPAEVPATPNPPGGMRGGTGIRYLTVAVASLDDTLAGLAGAGGSLVQPIIEHEGRRIAIIADPEGNVLELIDDGGA
jgi:predicted enzyme related to lactoylglutathione lyase